jgi:hypothetical protein
MITVPIMLFGWVPLTVFLFFTLKPHHAVLCSVIGGWLFLPMSGFDLPGIPAYTKGTAIAIGLILGGRISGHRKSSSFQWRKYDIPMIIWCLCPIASSLSNQLGLYNGLSDTFSQIIIWGIPYLCGRMYFNNAKTLYDLALGIVIGGLLYMPLCLYEIRMSPQLSNIFYGFFPHSFAQHARYGGFRPIVFMQHGLMVALWLAVATTITFWLWRNKELKYIKGIPVSIIFMSLAITTVLCKTAGAWFALIIGCGSYVLFHSLKMRLPFLLLLLVVPVYIGFRTTGLVTAHDIEIQAARFVDSDRIESLGIRLRQEDLFSTKAMERPLLGWGGYGRGWPLDPDTGQKMIQMVDSLWLITFSSKGFLGILSLVTATLIGPWIILRSTRKDRNDSDSSTIVPVVLSIIVILFMIDSLINGMLNPVYILIAGALISWHINQKHTQVSGQIPN